MWDPGLYRRFGDERSRPFYELIGRIWAVDPEFVADLGCGPGELTADLSRRWPSAMVLGVDSSAEMIAAAHEMLAGMTAESGLDGSAPAAGRLAFELADALDWQPDGPVDVIVSNALLQWIPDHEQLLVKWLGMLGSGGWLAFQVPANFDQPAHALLRELVTSPRWRPMLGDVALNRQAADPADYHDLLASGGCEVDAWETTYLHVLAGDDPVLRWYQGTGLRPVLAALDQDEATEFQSEYGRLLRKAYPRSSFGTVLPFRRVFVVAHLT